MSLGSQASARRSCNACRAQIDAAALRCRWCGATLAIAINSSSQPLQASSLTSAPQDLRQWDEKRSAIETNVEPSRSQDNSKVKLADGQPSDKPSRTTGIPTHTK